MEEKLTAEEAYNLSENPIVNINLFLEDTLEKIKIKAGKGYTREIIITPYSDNVNSKVVEKLKDLGYKVWFTEENYIAIDWDLKKKWYDKLFK